MTATPTMINPSIYLIADHLDAVLAHGEDLLALPPPPAQTQSARDTGQMQLKLAGQRAFLDEARTLETRLVSRVLRAREHAEQVRRIDGRFKPITDLFVTGTHSVADAAADLVDSTALDFNTGRDSIAYLRSRGMIMDETVVLPRDAALQITETFRLAGAIELGALLDLASAYLDALELHYELYGADAGVKVPPPARETEAPASA